MIVWIVWECINDWPEDGGGTYLQRIFRNKENAEKYCEQMNRKAEEERDKDIFYYIEDWPLD